MILGSANKPPGGFGIKGNDRANKNIFNNLHIEGFKVGLNVPLDSGRNYAGSILENSTFVKNTYNFRTRYLSNGQSAGYPGYFQSINNTFNITGNNIAPTARFINKAVGGLGVEFNASNSLDNNSPDQNSPGKGIVSYGWDFDNDGNIDEFGRKVKHYFNNAGSHEVALTVWDNQGATKTLSKTIQVAPKVYGNLITNGNFNTRISTPSTFETKFSSVGADKGWLHNGKWSWNSQIGNGGAAVMSKNAFNGIGQVMFDDHIRRGQQTLSFNLKNNEVHNFKANQITVSVWGVNGEFINNQWTVDGPPASRCNANEASKLTSANCGRRKSQLEEV